MPSRILRDSFLTSPSVLACPPQSQDRLPRYWLASDDWGCFHANPAVIGGTLFALRPDVDEETIARDLDAYERAGMLERWEQDGRMFGFWKSWGRHQRLRPDTRRKRIVPPSARAFPSFDAYYKADGDRKSANQENQEDNESAASSRKFPQVPASRARAHTHAPARVSDPDPSLDPNIRSPLPPNGGVMDIFNHWKATMGRQDAKLTAERRRKVEARLREGYSADDLKNAIDGCAKDKWHMGENEDGKRWDDLGLICRSGSKVEHFRQLATSNGSSRCNFCGATAGLRAVGDGGKHQACLRCAQDVALYGVEDRKEKTA